ncbi:MAG: type II toxin-antitoxin system RelE/ParE family toxin [Saprospiraceae bacterium]|nr:type II toxin-antitoxin system RelE/ParE family toxin [Saprospiraceae bacterium]
MAGLKVIWTETAVRQRRGIFEYWNKRNQSTKYSERIRVLVSKKIELIKKNPTSFLSSEYNDTYVAVIEHFCLYFKVVKEGILVTAFWDSRQDPDKLLEILKK